MLFSLRGKIFFFFLMVGVLFTTCRAQHMKEKLANRRDHLQEPTFWCPTCQNKSEEMCDANLRNTSCPKAQFCMALWDEKIFVRKCVNKPMLEIFTHTCKTEKSLSEHCVKKMTHEFDKHGQARNIRNNRPPSSTSRRALQHAIQHCKQQCHVRSCSQSGCKADAAKMPQPRYKFWCPTCPMTNSSGECDMQMEVTNCPRATMCIAVRNLHYSPLGRNLFTRKCVNHHMFSLIRFACRKKKGCEVASCTKSGCKAKF